MADVIRKTLHMKLSVRGALAWSPGMLRNALDWITHDDGTRYTVAELRRAFEDALAGGVEFLPMGDCPDFDPKTGCPGHVQP